MDCFCGTHTHTYTLTTDLHIGGYALYVARVILSLRRLSGEEAAVSRSLWELWVSGCCPHRNGRGEVRESGLRRR